MKYTKYETARLIGARALQLAMGAPLLVKISKDDIEKMNYSPVQLAKIEFSKNLLPITIKRPMPSKIEGYNYTKAQ